MPRVGQPDTSWTMIDSARQGDRGARERFARRYGEVVRAYFAARWRAGALEAEVDDAVQDVFVDCLRQDGALGRIDPGRPFRPFLHGVARTVALRFEQRRGKQDAGALSAEELEARDTRLSVAFDRAFAVELMQEATELQKTRARAAGGVKLRRVELLELRFQEGLSIAEIARSWKEEPSRLHHLYADAREDFRECLRETVARRNGGTAAELERECDWMLAVLQRSGA
jgi:RNA polymerase sigma factor (sigma-70 family)